MSELIESLLDVSRFERGVIPLHRKPLVLQDVIDDVIAVQRAEADQKGIRLSGHMPPDPVRVFADRQRIEQVLTNLITNAINYTDSEGSVSVDLEQEALSPDHPAGRAIIRVRDTGIGIEPELIAQVFEPFFRINEVKAGGTGLGLTIAREIVHLHQGEIAVESVAGQGSTFVIKLDLLAPSPPDSDTPGTG
jgi:signal transduction histidine kinase